MCGESLLPFWHLQLAILPLRVGACLVDDADPSDVLLLSSRPASADDAGVGCAHWEEVWLQKVLDQPSAPSGHCDRYLSSGEAIANALGECAGPGGSGGVPAPSQFDGKE